MNPFRTTSRPPGFTLVEATMAVVIVSSVLVAALGTLGAISRARVIQVERAAAVHLGEQLLAEIVQCYFEEPGGSAALGADAGETARNLYDDVDDYEGWEITPPTQRDGAAMTEYAGWKVSIRVGYARVSDPFVTEITATDLKRIKVTVTTAGGASFDLYGLRTKNGAYEQLPTVTTSYLTFGGVSAKVGERGRTIYGGSHPLNVTTSQ